ncbi:hypothetical protein NGK_p0001 (plasmid) [Neisseria gonorrhoeae NCCP11945]|uniref:Uncharacterized protein n=1 Tax=Neisseria gonorrhoeae (strain NCCP11945) TaxID=521006 RepID=B4RRF6_NEIG2|nr:hypothetical protein NGK_p0001 [Neisseria gonorrhoeae NCCP11945]
MVQVVTHACKDAHDFGRELEFDGFFVGCFAIFQNPLPNVAG